MLPSFIVIGAARSGTTSLHRYLGAHPQVFTSERKELDFFLEGHEARGDVRWYEAQFAKADDVAARASPPLATRCTPSRLPLRVLRVIPGFREHVAGLLADDVARFREIAGEEIDGWGKA